MAIQHDNTYIWQGLRWETGERQCEVRLDNNNNTHSAKVVSNVKHVPKKFFVKLET